MVAAVLDKHGVQPDQVNLEITESLVMHSPEHAAQTLQRFKAMGISLAIDDFGAGYTSFRNLQMLHVDTVKIDGSYVKELSQSPENQVFVRTLVGLARNFDIKTVAEWVQDEESALLLRDWGCDYIQGRLIGLASQQRPWPIVAEAAAGLAGKHERRHPAKIVLHALDNGLIRIVGRHVLGGLASPGGRGPALGHGLNSKIGTRFLPHRGKEGKIMRLMRVNAA